MLLFVLILWIYIIPVLTYTCVLRCSERTPNKLLGEITSGVGVWGLGVDSSIVISFINFCTVGAIYLFVCLFIYVCLFMYIYLFMFIYFNV